MGLNSLQVCMDSSDWLQGTINDESGGMDSSSPCGDMITCSRPLIERRLRPQHDQALNCPRCDSTHTKFCYYNNYSLSQPRYFCKTCRRYWTKGGTLRNIPVGGGCRKNKKVSSKKSNNEIQSINQNPSSSSSSYNHHHQVHNLLGNPYFNMVENPNNKGIIDSRNYDFMGNGDMGFGGFGEINNGLGSNYGFCNPFDGNSGNLIDTCQRLMLPYDGNGDDHTGIEMKPNAKRIMSLDWQDQGNYINNVGSWSNMMMHGYGPSTTNPLV